MFPRIPWHSLGSFQHSQQVTFIADQAKINKLRTDRPVSLNLRNPKAMPINYKVMQEKARVKQSENILATKIELS